MYRFTKYAWRFLQLLALWSTVVVLFALQWYTYDLLHGTSSSAHYLLPLGNGNSGIRGSCSRPWC